MSVNNSYYLARVNNLYNVWRVPPEIMRHFNIKTNDIVELNLGSAVEWVRTLPPITESSGTIPTIELSSSLFQKLCIPTGTSVKIIKTSTGSFRLGPVLGILTFPGLIPQKLHYYKPYALLNQSNGFLYVFRGQNINPKDGTIKGWYFDVKNKVWRDGVFPFPDAVIDRRYPNSHRYLAKLEKIMGANKIFNRKTLITKIDFFNVLSTDKFLRQYLPETAKFINFNILRYFLNKYERVFLKPVNSMKGTGIVVICSTDSGLVCKYKCQGKEVVQKVRSPHHIHDIVKTAGGRKKRYIVQQGIDSIRYKEGPVSFRVCPMKNGKGEWEIVGIIALGSMGTAEITNYSSGGKAIPLAKLFHAILPLLPYEKKELLNILKGLALKTATALDNSFGPLGDLGVDIVVDKKGKPWLLEANGNPAKLAAFIQNDFPAWRTQVYKYPLDYATFLAGFDN